MKINWAEWIEYLPPLLMGAVYILSQVLFKKKPKNLSKTTEEQNHLHQEVPPTQDTQTETDAYHYPDETDESNPTFFEQIYGDSKPTPKEPSPLDIAASQPENQQLSKLELFQKAFDIEEPSTETPIPSNKSNDYNANRKETKKKDKPNSSDSYTTNLKQLSNPKSFKQAFILKELLDPPKGMR